MTASRSPGGIGARLREAREARGLSLRQIAGTTKIAVGVLEALEKNDISRLPGGIFGRAFVRAYAQEVGLDPEEIIREFIVQFPIETVTQGHPAARPSEDREAADSAERAAWITGRLALISIPVAALVVFATSGRSGAPTEGQAPAPTYAAEPRPPAAAPSSRGEVRADITPSQSEPPLVLSLAASGPCWVSIEIDGLVVFEREMRAGDRQRFEIDREFTIRAGNAAALALSIDGREIRSLGGSGEVVTFSANRDEVAELLGTP